MCVLWISGPWKNKVLLFADFWLLSSKLRCACRGDGCALFAGDIHLVGRRSKYGDASSEDLACVCLSVCIVHLASISKLILTIDCGECGTVAKLLSHAVHLVHGKLHLHVNHTSFCLLCDVWCRMMSIMLLVSFSLTFFFSPLANGVDTSCQTPPSAVSPSRSVCFGLYERVAKSLYTVHTPFYLGVGIYSMTRKTKEG